MNKDLCQKGKYILAKEGSVYKIIEAKVDTGRIVIWRGDRKDAYAEFDRLTKESEDE
jgi:hypothetical protein